MVKEYSAKIQKSIRTRENRSIELLDEDAGSSMLRGLSQRVPYSPMVKSQITFLNDKATPGGAYQESAPEAPAKQNSKLKPPANASALKRKSQRDSGFGQAAPPPQIENQDQNQMLSKYRSHTDLIDIAEEALASSYQFGAGKLADSQIQPYLSISKAGEEIHEKLDHQSNDDDEEEDTFNKQEIEEIFDFNPEKHQQQELEKNTARLQFEFQSQGKASARSENHQESVIKAEVSHQLPVNKSMLMNTLNRQEIPRMRMYSTDLRNQRMRDDVASQETVSMYQKHNLIGKGPIHDMLASNYSMEKTVILAKRKMPSKKNNAEKAQQKQNKQVLIVEK